VGFLYDNGKENMRQIELKITNVKFHSFTSRTDYCTTYVPALYSHYTFLPVSALKGPFSGSTYTFCEQVEQNVWYMYRVRYLTLPILQVG